MSATPVTVRAAVDRAAIADYTAQRMRVTRRFFRTGPVEQKLTLSASRNHGIG